MRCGTTFEGASSMVDPPEQQTPREGGLDSASEQNLHKLLREAEKIRTATQASSEQGVEPEPPHLDRFLQRARTLYESQDLKSCLEILHEGLKLAPGHPEVLALMQMARQASELKQAELEASDLIDRMAQFKAEAIALFEQGRYSDCVEKFKLLSELEPTNYDLRDYLEISREQAEKQRQQLNSATDAPLKNQDTAVPKNSIPDILKPALASQGDPPAAVTVNGSGTLAFPTAQPLPPSEQAHEDSMAEVVPTPEFKPLPAKPEPPRTAQANKTKSRDPRAGAKAAGPRPAVEGIAPTPDLAQLRAKKLKFVYLVGAGLVIGAVLGAWVALNPLKHSVSPEVPPQPRGSQVRVDPPPFPVDSSALAENDLQTEAQQAFRQGRFLEANRLCETILGKQPDHSFALNLKEQIRERFSSLGNQAAANQRWDEAALAWNNVLRVFPNDSEAARQLKAVRANLKKREQSGVASKLESEKRIQELRQQISMAVSSGRYLPPVSGNALELIQQLEELSPQDTFAKERLDQIFRDLMTQAKRALQTKDSAHASMLVKQLQKHFPETLELKGLRESIKAEEARFAEARNSWTQKAEAAMAAGRYVTPANDNAIAYCNQLLAVEPQNSKALELKKESSAKASAQAKVWVQEGKYDDARTLYSGLLSLSQNESQLSLNSQQLKAEVDRLTFNAYPVAHDHTFGSCTGRLRFNSYHISYVPTTDSKDGFAVKLSEVVQVESDDKLKIHFKGKAYRFQANATRNAVESRAKISEIHQRLSALIANK